MSNLECLQEKKFCILFSILFSISFHCFLSSFNVAVLLNLGRVPTPSSGVSRSSPDIWSPLLQGFVLQLIRRCQAVMY